MEKLNNLIRFLGVGVLALTIVINHYGLIYDVTKEKFDKNYKGNHSIKWKNGKFWFSIPSFINDKSDISEINRIKNKYNKNSIAFWIVIASIIIIYAIENT